MIWITTLVIAAAAALVKLGSISVLIGFQAMALKASAAATIVLVGLLLWRKFSN